MTREETPIDEKRLLEIRTRLANAVYGLDSLRQTRELMLEYARRTIAELDALYVDDEPLDPRKEARGTIDLLDALEIDRESLTARGLEKFRDRAKSALTTATSASGVDDFAEALALTRGFVDTIGAEVARLALELEDDARPTADEEEGRTYLRTDLRLEPRKETRA